MTRVHNPRGRGQVSNQQERPGARPARQGPPLPEYPPDQDGRGGAEDAGSPPRGRRGTLENWATWWGEGLRRGTHLHSLTSLSPHAVQQVGLTRDLNSLHKHEPKAHTHPPPNLHTHARAHAHALRPTPAPTPHAHAHTHTVRTCRGTMTATCCPGLHGALPSRAGVPPAKHKTRFLKIMKIKKTKNKKIKNSLIILTQTFNNGRSLLCADTVKCPPVLQLSVISR